MNVNFLSIKFHTNWLFFILSINLFYYISSNKIVLPFFTKTYPFDPNDEFKFIFKNEIYTTLEVGTPSKKVELYLTTRTPFFIIKYNNSFPEYYKNFSSSTYKYYDTSSIYYFNDDVLKRGIHSGEKIFLQNSFNDKDKIEIPNLDFIYGTDYKGDSKRHMGVLGIQFLSTSSNYDKEVNFINTLKRNRLISNYIWNLNYTSDNSGYLVIGEYPHSFNEKKYNKEYLNQINVHQEGAQKVVWNLFFDNITYGETKLNEHRTGKFAPQYGVIFGPLIFDRLITKEFFEEYINNKKCERKTYDNKHDYYVCDEDINLSKFKSIEFKAKGLSEKNFTLTKDDLFLKKNGKLYFLMAFGRKWKWQYSWTLGKPFMKKYNFLFDQDGKQILYYNKVETPRDTITQIFESKTFLYFLYGGIGVLLIVIGFLVYYLVRILKERKKKLYELEDEYDYVENNGDKNNSVNDAFKFEGEPDENKFGF